MGDLVVGKQSGTPGVNSFGLKQLAWNAEDGNLYAKKLDGDIERVVRIGTEMDPSTSNLHLRAHAIDSVADHPAVDEANMGKLIYTDPVTGLITFLSPSTLLNGYATRLWVQQQGYLTSQHWSRDAVNGSLYPGLLTDKVGIGTNAPDSNIHIYNATAKATLKLNSSYYSEILLGTGSPSPYNYFCRIQTASDNGGISPYFKFYSDMYGPTYYTTYNGYEWKMGTSSYPVILYVSGKLYLCGSNGCWIDKGDSSNHLKMFGYSGIRLSTSSVNAIEILTNGNTGFNTLLPKSKISIALPAGSTHNGLTLLRSDSSFLSSISVDTATTEHLQIASVSGIRFYTSSAFSNTVTLPTNLRMILTTAGLLGLKTDAPTRDLDINGTFRVRTLADGSAYPKILVADANGNVDAVDKTSIASSIEIPALILEVIDGKLFAKWEGYNTAFLNHTPKIRLFRYSKAQDFETKHVGKEFYDRVKSRRWRLFTKFMDNPTRKIEFNCPATRNTRVEIDLNINDWVQDIYDGLDFIGVKLPRKNRTALHLWLSEISRTNKHISHSFGLGIVLTNPAGATVRPYKVWDKITAFRLGALWYEESGIGHIRKFIKIMK